MPYNQPLKELDLVKDEERAATLGLGCLEGKSTFSAWQLNTTRAALATLVTRPDKSCQGDELSFFCGTSLALASTRWV